MPTTISLRPWVPEDAPRMAQLLNVPAVWRFLAAALPVPYTVEHAREFIAACMREPGLHERAVLRSGEAVGTIGVQMEGKTALIGYWLGAEYHQQGIMSRALPLFIASLPPHITLLRAKVFDFNPASIALLRRCGFTESPEAALELAQDGEWHAIRIFVRAR